MIEFPYGLGSWVGGIFSWGIFAEGDCRGQLTGTTHHAPGAGA